jgi:alpha-1,3-rhamnosyl/mannosyltransferase
MDKRVFRTGYLNEESLACLYSSALALVFPSLYEGFGLPVIEAMACGCPVICSNAASLPEVAGDAALLIDPHNVDELAGAIDRVVDDSALRNDLIRKGTERASQFSWKRTAKETLAVFRSVA